MHLYAFQKEITFFVIFSTSYDPMELSLDGERCKRFIEVCTYLLTLLKKGKETRELTNKGNTIKMRVYV